MSNNDEIMQELQKALDNEENSYIMNLTNQKIEQIKKNSLQDLFLNEDEIENILDKLEDYIYVDGMSDLKSGCYIRWIDLKDPNNIKLSRGATICDIEIRQDGTFIICKNNYGYKRGCFQIKMDENFLFRKLTDQEKVLLSVMNYLNKN